MYQFPRALASIPRIAQLYTRRPHKAPAGEDLSENAENAARGSYQKNEDRQGHAHDCDGHRLSGKVTTVTAWDALLAGKISIGLVAHQTVDFPKRGAAALMRKLSLPCVLISTCVVCITR